MPPARSEGEDDRVLSGFLNNDPEAIATVARWARSVASHRAWGFEAPEDLVQATLLAILRNLREDRFRSGDLERYVRTVAKNICISSYRRARARSRELLLHESEGHEREAAAPGPDPAQLALLETILRKLDARCRQLIRLAYLEDLSRKEIARRLGITETAAKVRLFRCLELARAAARAGGATP